MSKPTGSSYSLTEIFGTKNIKIPPYQRTYDWRKSHLEGLISDLSEHIDIQDKLHDFPYFLGNLMIHKDDQDDKEFWYLVDGQQRMVTMTLIAGYIRDKLIQEKEYKEAFELQNAVISEDPEGDKRYFTPRITGKIDSPDVMLWPVQSPSKQKISFSFDQSYSVGKHSLGMYNIKDTDCIAKFPLATGTYEIRSGAELEIHAPIEAGADIKHFYGTLDVKSEIKEDDICEIKFRGREGIIDTQLTDGKWPDYLIRKHFKRHLPQILDSRFENLGTNERIKDLKKWKDIITHMHFTTTTFTSESDAIFYFGKLNESETKLQLNVGDLMRHHVQYITTSPPKNPTVDDQIQNHWDKVENRLKSEKMKDMIPSFMDGWLISQGRKQSKRLIYKSLKEDLSKHKNGSKFDKNKVSVDMKEIQEASSYFRQIVFPEETDDYYLRMDCFERLGDQHRGLFLAGFLGFYKFNDKKSMQRLMDIWELLKMKGEQIPKMCDFDGIPSNEIYSYVNKWCKKIYSVNNFSSKIPPAQAKIILDSMAEQVKVRCDNLWTSIPISWAGEEIADIVKSIQMSQHRSKMILTRIEMSKMGSSKTWKSDVEVEHIAPQKYQEDWIDKSKGGGFDSKNEYNNMYIQNIGNRTLLDPGSNNHLSNLSFHEKQIIADHGYNYQCKNWYVTKGLESAKTKTWGPNQIEKRAKELIKELVELYKDKFIGL